MTQIKDMLALVVLALSGCVKRAAESQSAPSATIDAAPDAWLRFSSSADFSDCVTIAQEAVSSVAAEQQAEAQSQLVEQAWRTVDEVAARRLTGHEFVDAQAPGVLVLLRALRSAPDGSGLEKEDRYLVRWKHGAVAVSHFAGRRAPTEQLCHAIVVRLPAEPTEVYVECLAAIHDLPNR